MTSLLKNTGAVDEHRRELGTHVQGRRHTARAVGYPDGSACWTNSETAFSRPARPIGLSVMGPF
jgi:hypothetical protein